MNRISHPDHRRTVWRSILLLNNYPELKVSALLEPGASTGSTNVHVKAEDKLPIHATLDYNNYGFNTISRNRFGAGIEVGNVIFDGATLNFNGIMGDHPDRLLFLTGAYAVPIGVHGTKLVLSGSNGRFDVGAELAAFSPVPTPALISSRASPDPAHQSTSCFLKACRLSTD